MSRLARRILLLLVLCSTGVIGYFSIVQASDIRTELCEESYSPSLFITSPLSDSIVNRPDLRLQGTALRTDQITIFINGTQDSIIPVEPTGVVDTTVSLTKGTNSLSLHAYYNCNQTNMVTTFVVTYEPNAPTSDGSSVVTDMPSPGTVSKPNSIISIRPSSPIDSDPAQNPKTEDDEKDGSKVDHIDPNTGKILPRMCEGFYVLSFTHVLALILLGFLLRTTERLYKLASRTRRRPSRTLKLTIRCIIVFLAGLLLWLLTRMVVNCV